ncbi:securin isoform X2 [Colossoma macropomum]|uniref:securin isoform X2 n=1 Tax=Colossoma macropomum TaxID=42526 RepID=UPI0018651EEC|nr:securin isoform X2 [Colossoma macropomum]
MDALIYLDQENGRLTAPTIKSRQRLQSAPEQLLKTPLHVKKLGAPVQSARKALGTVNKIVSTPAVSHKGEAHSKPLGAQCKVPPQPACEDYPEIEKCFPFNPSDFEVYSVPEEVCLSRFSLAGLGRQQWSPSSLEEDFIMDPCLPQSPLKMPSEYCRDDLEAFLETINELTVDLPPECDY